jgi:hypothetical protein
MTPNCPPAALPPEVLALAKRLGAGKRPAMTGVRLHQKGELRTDPAAKWMAFTAHQWIRADTCAFSWTARTGPLRAIRVVDSLIKGEPRGGVSLLGIIPLDSAAPSPGLLKGELLRYLAELPWIPDAMLANPLLSWRVHAPDRIEVAVTLGEVNSSVTFTLDDAGLPASAAGPRPHRKGARFHDRVWTGFFADYQEVSERLVPFAGRVGWTLDAKHHDGWRGDIIHWTPSFAI